MFSGASLVLCHFGRMKLKPLLTGLLGLILTLAGSFSIAAEVGEIEKVDQEQEKSPALKQMEGLAEAGIQEALKALQRSGGFYPFAMIIDSASGQVQLVGYSGDPDSKPPADDFAVALFLQLREKAAKEPGVIAAVVLKPFLVQAAEGKAVPGVWAAVDHRSEEPWVMFQPLIEHKPGRYVLGQIIYQQSEEAIFPEVP